MMTDEKSEICEFFRGKHVFLTGGTGFLGKCLIDKLIRVCHVGKIYLLIRPKKGKDPFQRLSDIFNGPEFSPMKNKVPDFMTKLEAVIGDVSHPFLGLDEQSKLILSENVEVVIHAAATVNFNAKLSQAIRFNVLGTKYMLELCHTMQKLKSVVHVSTAYSHCYRQEIDEKFYDCPISGDRIMMLTDCLSEKQIDAMETMLLGDWPNTYTFSKAAAEDVVKDWGKGLPIAIFRPSIVITTNSEPVSGWTDNLYGPMGIMIAVGAGVIKVVQVDETQVTDVVPADYVVNALLSATYKRSLAGPDAMDIPIFNYVSGNTNPITWRGMSDCCRGYALKTPSAQAIWYYSLLMTSSPVLYYIARFFLHIVPAAIADCILFAMNKKPRALKIFKKIHTMSTVVTYFSMRSWKFHSNNVQLLYKEMKPADKALFPFDIKSLDWDKYFEKTVVGLRFYIFKEPTDNIKYARKRYYRLYLLDRAVRVFLIGLFLYSVIKLYLFLVPCWISV